MSGQYITPNKVRIRFLSSTTNPRLLLQAGSSPSSSSSSPYTPMSERQQLALIKQLTEQKLTPDKAQGTGGRVQYSSVQFSTVQ